MTIAKKDITKVCIDRLNKLTQEMSLKLNEKGLAYDVLATIVLNEQTQSMSNLVVR